MGGSVGAMPLHYRLRFPAGFKITRVLSKKISDIFYNLYPFKDIDVILVEGGNPLREGSLLKRRLNDVKLVLLVADPLFQDL